MARPRKTLEVGSKWNRWTVIENGLVKHRSDGIAEGSCRCRCECGTERVVLNNELKHNHSKSCGCFARESSAMRNSRHGRYLTPEYDVWHAMHQRCRNQNSKNYGSYGGRGISVCEQWSDFATFLADVGERPAGTSLDRWPDNNGNYEPGNVRWATLREQANNKRVNRILHVNGESMTVAQWTSRQGFARHLIYSRLAQGWSNEKAVLTPAGKYHKTPPLRVIECT